MWHIKFLRQYVVICSVALSCQYFVCLFSFFFRSHIKCDDTLFSLNFHFLQMSSDINFVLYYLFVIWIFFFPKCLFMLFSRFLIGFIWFNLGLSLVSRVLYIFNNMNLFFGCMVYKYHFFCLYIVSIHQFFNDQMF